MAATAARNAMIAVDWGTSSLRAALLADNGTITAQISGGPGILAVEAGAFGEALRTFLSRLPAVAPDVPILMSGMIGSRQGWREVAYLACPVPLSTLATALAQVSDDRLGTLHIVPGLSVEPPGGAPDVMRGEETQVIGALDWLGASDGVFVLPGTHSKWVEVRGRTIRTFSTYMTGEIYSCLRQHSILGRLMPPGEVPHDDSSFRSGVSAGAAEGHPGHLLNRVFAARTLGLFDRVPASGLASYLSGLLIGAEIAAALTTAAGSKRFVIVGSAPGLAANYLAAAAELGCEGQIAPSDCSARGAFRIATAAGLIRCDS